MERTPRPGLSASIALHAIAAAIACGDDVAPYTALDPESDALCYSVLDESLYTAPPQRIVVERHHGAIEIDTSPRGTTMRVRLPLELGPG